MKTINRKFSRVGMAFAILGFVIGTNWFARPA